jgi:antitoxin MazE
VRAKIQKWGNGIGLRVPKAIANGASLHAGSEVELTVVNGRLVVAPVDEDPSLEEMLDRVTDENRHGLIDWGPAVGKEAW